MCACFQFPKFDAFLGLSCGPVMLQVTSTGSKVVSWRWGKIQE